MAKILVADYAAFMRKLLIGIIKRAGHELVGEAENGQDAIDKYKALKPDLAKMDMVMPKVGEIDGGIAAVREIIKFDPAARVIMVSAMGQHGYVAQAIDAGAKDFIT